MSNIENNELQIIPDDMSTTLHNKNILLTSFVDDLLFDGKYIKAFQIRPMNAQHNGSDYLFIDIGYVVSEGFYNSHCQEFKSFFKEETSNGEEIYYRRVITLQISKPNSSNKYFIEYLHHYYFLLDEIIEKTGIEALFYTRGSSISFLELPSFVLKDVLNSNGNEQHNIGKKESVKDKINIIIDNTDNFNKVCDSENKQIIADVETYSKLFNDGIRNKSSTLKELYDYMNHKGEKVNFVFRKTAIAKAIVGDGLNNITEGLNINQDVFSDIANEIEKKDIDAFYKSFVEKVDQKGLKTFIETKNINELYENINKNYRVSMDKSGFNRMKTYSLIEKIYSIFNSIDWGKISREEKIKYGLLFYYVVVNLPRLELYDVEKILDVNSSYSKISYEFIKLSIIDQIDLNNGKIDYKIHTNESMSSNISSMKNCMKNVNSIKTEIVKSVYDAKQQDIASIDYDEAIRIAKNKNFINDDLTSGEEEKLISIVIKDIIKFFDNANSIKNSNNQYSVFYDISSVENTTSIIKKVIKENKESKESKINVYSSLLFYIWRKSFLEEYSRFYSGGFGNASLYNYLSKPLGKELYETLFSNDMKDILSRKNTKIYNDFCSFYSSFIDEPDFNVNSDKDYQWYYGNDFFNLISILYLLNKKLELEIGNESWEKLIKETHSNIRENSKGKSSFANYSASAPDPLETPLFSLLIDFISIREKEKINWLVKNMHNIHDYAYNDNNNSINSILNIKSQGYYRNYLNNSAILYKAYLLFLNHLRENDYIENIINGDSNLVLSYNIEIVPKIMALNSKDNI